MFNTKLKEEMESKTAPTLEHRFTGHRGAIKSVDFCPDLKYVVTGSSDKSLILWNFTPDTRVLQYFGHEGPVMSVCFSPNGMIIASGSSDHKVRFWLPHLKDKHESVSFIAHRDTVKCVNFSSCGKNLITSSDDGTIKVWDVKDQKHLYLFKHDNIVNEAKFSKDDRLIVSGSHDKTVKVWDNVSKDSVFETNVTYGVRSVDFHPSGTCIAAAYDNKIKIWDIRMKKLLQKYEVHEDLVNSINFHPAGNYLLSGSNDNITAILDTANGRLFYSIQGHTDSINKVKFSKCGKYFASVGSDKLLLIWKANFDNEKTDSPTKTNTISTSIRDTSEPSDNDNLENKNNETQHSLNEDNDSGFQSVRKGISSGLGSTTTEASQAIEVPTVLWNNMLERVEELRKTVLVLNERVLALESKFSK